MLFFQILLSTFLRADLSDFWLVSVAAFIIHLFVFHAYSVRFSLIFFLNISINTMTSQSTRPLYTFQFSTTDIVNRAEVQTHAAEDVLAALNAVLRNCVS